MGKNIIIYSDGTGQFGGLRPDQTLSNIYKLYRATRPSIDTDIDPAKQIAFYDPGLGTGEAGAGWVTRLSRLFESAFGTNISANITDCYEAILRHYVPGDRIYLFGFSRGAYTARCVANVLNLCGVPSHRGDGTPLPRQGAALRKIAEEAVYDVYEHGAGHARAQYEDEREEKARRFRAKYGSDGTGLEGESQGNVAPYFVGVFDTVASLGSGTARTIIAVAALLSIALAAGAYFLTASLWLTAFASIPAVWLLILLVAKWKRQRKVIRDYPEKGTMRRHTAIWLMKHYDRFLDTNVRFARHACSIDENRKHFPIAGWGNPDDVKRQAHLDPPWLRQVWFAGNHSDIGGGHAEDESRLSDVALQWMIEQLEETDHPVHIDRSKLSIWPDALGVQHEARQGLIETLFPSWWPKFLQFTWPYEARTINPKAQLHPSVLQRFSAESISDHCRICPYRPVSLRAHSSVGHLYD